MRADCIWRRSTTNNSGTGVSKALHRQPAVPETEDKESIPIAEYGENTMGEIRITKLKARQFILLKQGLLGEHRFIGKEGILQYIRQAGCIQFDPVDVCGKNADLVLQSRVKGYTKQLLYELLYEDRRLVDYFDKNLSIMAVEDWPYFERVRMANRLNGKAKEEIDKIEEEIKAIIADKGPVSSKELGFDEKIDWYWSSTKLARAALESLYFRGDLIVHHKKGTIKFYDLAEKHIPEEILRAEDPLPEELEHLKWRVLRRISAIGLLWNKPSDAWLFIWNLKSLERNLVFEELKKEGRIIPVQIEGCKDTFYCCSEDLPILEQVMEEREYKPRMELIAALDNMLWDRKLIRELFGFDYKWEIYTPQEQRKYGHYVIPLLSGEQLIGRCEIIADTKKKKLTVKNVWLEKGIKPTKKRKEELERCFERFAKFNGMKDTEYAEDYIKICR